MTQKVRFKILENFGFGPNVMKKSKVCVRCGQLVKTRSAVCPECGEKLPRETLFDRYKKSNINKANPKDYNGIILVMIKTKGDMI